MTELTYLPARLVAPLAEEHFARCAAEGDSPLDLRAPSPDAETIEAIVSTAFWASLRREEGVSPKISIALLRPDETESAMIFGHPLRATPATLAKLAPAVLRPGIHLGVWRDEAGLYIWGATRSIPVDCFVLEVVEPGLLVVKRRRRPEGGKFANFVVLQGDEVKVVDEGGGALADGPLLLAGLLELDTARGPDDARNGLVNLAISMRDHGHGGSLLVVPHRSERWRESMAFPILYPVDPPFTELATLVERGQGEDGILEWRESLRRAVDTIAGVTAVDGATVISDRFELIAFGAKITRREAGRPVERVILSEPIAHARASIVEPSHLGGTRHLSAAQFVQDQPDSLALVASQDGRFTVFAWSAPDEMVRAQRLESLLL